MKHPGQGDRDSKSVQQVIEATGVYLALYLRPEDIQRVTHSLLPVDLVLVRELRDAPLHVFDQARVAGVGLTRRRTGAAF